MCVIHNESETHSEGITQCSHLKPTDIRLQKVEVYLIMTFIEKDTLSPKEHGFFFFFLLNSATLFNLHSNLGASYYCFQCEKSPGNLLMLGP